MKLTKQQLEEQIATTENYLQQLRTMEAAVEPEAVKEWPQDGDTVWLLQMDLTNGQYVLRQHQFGSFICGAALLKAGMVYRSAAMARRRLEAMKVAAELRRMPGRCGPPNNGNAWCVRYSGGGEGFGPDCFSMDYNGHFALAGVWFSTEDDVHHAIETIGQDRLGVYLADFLDEPMGDE